MSSSSLSSSTAAAAGTTVEVQLEPGLGDNSLSPAQAGSLSKQRSSVSFREPHVESERASEPASPRAQANSGPPSRLTSVRYYVMLLALISPFVTTYSRTIINFALTDMIEPDYLVRPSARGSTEVPQSLANGSELAGQVEQRPYFDLDNSCPVDDEVRARLLEEASPEWRRSSVKRATSRPDQTQPDGPEANHEEAEEDGQGEPERVERFRWDTVQQGLLKGAYSIGHSPFQIPGGRMSELYGSHRVMVASTMLIGLCCLAAPYLASMHFYLLVGDLMLLGVLGSFSTPALLTLVSNWLTPSEKSLMQSLYMVSSRLGFALSALLCGLLIEARLSWRYVFFSAGWLATVFSVTLLVCARSRPTDHPLVGPRELRYLAAKNTLVRERLAKKEARRSKGASERYELGAPGSQRKLASPAESSSSGQVAKKSRSAPWAAILTNVPLWAFIVTKFCVKMAGDFVQIELPTYLKLVMHFGAKDNGVLNAWNYVIFCAGCLIIGSLGPLVIKRRPFGLSKTALRKCFQSCASFGVSLCLVGIAFSVCDSQATQGLLLVLFFVTTFGSAGEAQIPLDITERYSGTLHAIGSSVAMTGAIEPTIVGFFIRGRAADREAWRGVWLMASGIAFTGGLVFALFADATKQPFDSLDAPGDAEAANGAAGAAKVEAAPVTPATEALRRDGDADDDDDDDEVDDEPKQPQQQQQQQQPQPADSQHKESKQI